MNGRLKLEAPDSEGQPLWPGLFERWSRKMAYEVLLRLTPTGRVRFTDFLKWILPPTPLPNGDFSASSHLPFPRPVDFQAAIYLTHDVDWVEGYAFVPRIADLEEEAGVRSTFHFLANGGYRPERALLEDLTARGFEVGLHGWDHDPALAYRPKSLIRETLLRARNALGVEVRAFRSPALSTSPRLYEILLELGFSADSSLVVGQTVWGGEVPPWPYRFPGSSMVEIPLVLQDSTLFRDHLFNLEEGMACVRQVWEVVRQAEGCLVFNVHPGIIAKRWEYLKQMMDFLKDIPCRTLVQIVEGLR